jgi:hypothetical protein
MHSHSASASRQPAARHSFSRRLPSRLAIAAAVLVVLALLPLLLMFLGADLSSPHFTNAHPADSPHSRLEFSAAHRALQGSILHAIFEWTAVLSAALVFLLALVQFRITSDNTLLVIGVAMACAGVMDLFHLLTSLHILPVRAPGDNILPFAWVLARIANALILLGGVGYLCRLSPGHSRRLPLRKALFACAMIIVLCAAALGLVAASPALPQTMFPDEWIKRPFDAIPILAYLLCAAFVFPAYRRLHPTWLSDTLLLSLIPHLAAQAYMAFGSHRLFDASFHSAHFFKALAYLLPVFGLLLQYVQTFRNEESLSVLLSERANQLDRQAAHLDRSKTFIHGLTDFTARLSSHLDLPSLYSAFLFHIRSLLSPRAATIFFRDADGSFHSVNFAAGPQHLSLPPKERNSLLHSAFHSTTPCQVAANSLQSAAWPIALHGSTHCVLYLETASRLPEEHGKFLRASLPILAGRIDALSSSAPRPAFSTPASGSSVDP